MRKALAIIIIIIIINFTTTLLLQALLILPPASGTDSTPSASVKGKLDALKQEIASKAAKLKTEINRKLQNKAYIGIVKSKSDSSITLATKAGSKLVSVNQDTQYEDLTPQKKGTKRKAPSLQTITEESNLAGLGDVDDTGVLNAKKIIILPPPTVDHKLKTIIWGQITSASDDIIAIKTKDGRTEGVSVAKIDSKFKTNDFVIITGVKGKNDILEASSLFVISHSPQVTPKVATPSGKK